MLYKNYNGNWYLIRELVSDIDYDLESRRMDDNRKYERQSIQTLKKNLEELGSSLNGIKESIATDSATDFHVKLKMYMQDLLSITVYGQDSKGEFRNSPLCGVLKTIGNRTTSLRMNKQNLALMEQLVRADSEKKTHEDYCKLYEKSQALWQQTVAEFRDTYKQEETLRKLYTEIAALRDDKRFFDQARAENGIWQPLEVLLKEADERLSKMKEKWLRTLSQERNYVTSEVGYAYTCVSVATDDTSLYISRNDWRNNETMTILANAAFGQAIKAVDAHSVCYMQSGENSFDRDLVTVRSYWRGVWRTETVLQRTRVLLHLAGILARSEAEKSYVKSLSRQYAELARHCKIELNRVDMTEGGNSSIPRVVNLFTRLGELRDFLRERHGFGRKEQDS